MISEPEGRLDPEHLDYFPSRVLERGDLDTAIVFASEHTSSKSRAPRTGRRRD